MRVGDCEKQRGMSEGDHSAAPIQGIKQAESHDERDGTRS